MALGFQSESVTVRLRSTERLLCTPQWVRARHRSRYSARFPSSALNHDGKLAVYSKQPHSSSRICQMLIEPLCFSFLLDWWIIARARGMNKLTLYIVPRYRWEWDLFDRIRLIQKNLLNVSPEDGINWLIGWTFLSDFILLYRKGLSVTDHIGYRDISCSDIVSSHC